MYAVLVDLDYDYYVVKFGYTQNLNERLASLRSCYKTNVQILSIKVIKYLYREILLHTDIRTDYPELIQDRRTIKPGDGKEKIDVELYKLSPTLLDKYVDYMHKNNNNETFVQLVKSEMQIVKRMIKYYDVNYYELLRAAEQEIISLNETITLLRQSNMLLDKDNSALDMAVTDLNLQLDNVSKSYQLLQDTVNRPHEISITNNFHTARSKHKRSQSKIIKL